MALELTLFKDDIQTVLNLFGNDAPDELPHRYVYTFDPTKVNPALLPDAYTTRLVLNQDELAHIISTFKNTDPATWPEMYTAYEA